MGSCSYTNQCEKCAAIIATEKEKRKRAEEKFQQLFGKQVRDYGRKATATFFSTIFLFISGVLLLDKAWQLSTESWFNIFAIGTVICFATMVWMIIMHTRYRIKKWEIFEKKASL